MMIGEFDYQELLEADETMAYFFFFIYMLFFTFILLNIFIAILERAYTKIKTETEAEEANVTVFESFIIYFYTKIKGLFSKKNERKMEHKKISKN